MKSINFIKTYQILGIDIHSTNLQNVKTVLESVLNSNSTPNLITTFNLDFLRITTIDPEFKNICTESLYNFPDGYGIVSIIKKKYKEKINRITGTDIFLTLIKLAKEHNKKIAIIGGSESVSQLTEQLLINQYYILSNNLLCISPEYLFEQNKNTNSSIVKKVKEFQPDIVFAALGCPRQEKWLFNNMNIFGSKINVGIGATLDFFTGKKRRSPVFLQKIGLEWLWRLMNEPIRLFERYILKDLPFFLKIIFKV